MTNHTPSLVGTRTSRLAQTQTAYVIRCLQALCSKNGFGHTFQTETFVTKGDTFLTTPLSQIGGKGLFVSELEDALLAGKIAFAVHSVKDMPAELPTGLTIGCIPVREDARDVLITKDGRPLSQLPEEAIVGTSSLRRAAQLRRQFPLWRIVPLRGNVDTRLQKLQTEGMDAIVLAAAGLHRLGWHARITTYLDPMVCVPAGGQGALAIECREDDADILALLALFEHPPTRRAVLAERAFLQAMQGGCHAPIGAYAVIQADDSLALTGAVGDVTGGVVLQHTVYGDDPLVLVEALRTWMIQYGAPFGQRQGT